MAHGIRREYRRFATPPDLAAAVEADLLDDPEWFFGWITVGSYQYEYGPDNTFTGWYRCVDGRLADESWPAWHDKTGAKRTYTN